MSSAGGVVACALAAAAALSGCFLVEESGCVADADCSAGQLCRDGACLARCDALGATVAGCVVCGDGVLVRPDEQCDDGLANSDASDACRPKTCLLPYCGDGVIDSGHGEACDPPGSGAVGCTQSCAIPVCGDGSVDGRERCDDGNTTSGDGCDADCSVSGCGNGYVGPGEACDLGVARNDRAGEPCDATCQRRWPRPDGCGDGVVVAPEACDDGNANDYDACDSECGFTHRRVIDLAAADEFSLVLYGDGRIFAAGLNEHGQLARGDRTDSGVPRQIQDDRRFARVSAEGRHVLAITTDGELVAWGPSARGECGPDVFFEEAEAPTGVPLGPDTVALDAWAGSEVSYVRARTGGPEGPVALLAFGTNEGGELGVPRDDRSHPIPAPIAGLSGVPSQLASGAGGALALVDGRMVAWGTNTMGRFGAAGRDEVIGPAELALPAGVTELRGVTLGATMVAALGPDGRLFGLGPNGEGTLGVGDLAEHPEWQEIFTAATPAPARLEWVRANGWSLFALDDLGRLYSAGAAAHGRLGRPPGAEQAPHPDGSWFPVSSTPAPVEFHVPAPDPAAPDCPLPPPTRIVRASIGREHALAVDDQGRVWGFGAWHGGALGNGQVASGVDDETSSATPNPLPGWTRCEP